MAASFSNYLPSLALNETIIQAGLFPSRDGGGAGSADGVVGQIETFAFGYSFNLAANGQTLGFGTAATAGNTPLVAVLGTLYGGNGTSSFQLPNLIDSAMVGAGTGAGLAPETVGEVAGSSATTLTTPNLPTSFGGSGQGFNSQEPTVAVTYFINTAGYLPGAASPENTTLDGFVGEVSAFAGNFAPGGSLACDGQVLPIAAYQDLYSVIGTTYGGNAAAGTFALPDLQGRVIVGASAADPIGTKAGADTTVLTAAQTAGTQPMPVQQPSLAMEYLICVSGGLYPPQGGAGGGLQDAFLGQVISFAGSTVPSGWALCDGSLLNIQDNPELYTVLGTTYGGDGQKTFALPNLVGKDVIGMGGANALGATIGADSVTLTSANVDGTTFSPTITGAGSTTLATIGSVTDRPFTGVSVNDSNTGSPTETLTINLSDPNASLAVGSAVNGVTFTGGDGVYVLTGSAANVTSELDGLTLTPPPALTGTVNGVEALAFSLSDVSSAGGAPPATAGVTADIAPVRTPPTITGAGSTTVALFRSTTITPFSGVTVSDGNAGNPTDTLTIDLSDPNAALAVGSAVTGVAFTGGNGVYMLSGSAAGVTSELDALTLTATTASAREQLTLSLSDVSSADPSEPQTASVTANITPSEIIVASATTQAFIGSTTDTPFAGVTIADTYFGTGNLTITLSDPNAALAVGSAVTGVAFTGGNGVYTLSGSDSGITSELDALTLSAPTTLTGAVNGVETLAFSLVFNGTGFAAASATAKIAHVWGVQISTISQLDQAIASADGVAANTGALEIDLAAGADIQLTQALQAINLKSGVTLDIEGDGATLDGLSAQRGLFVDAGEVTVDNLSLENMKAQGGAGDVGGGGGAGLGGALFVGDSVNGDAGQVTLENVDIAGASAIGGAGGAGSVSATGGVGGLSVTFSDGTGAYGSAGGFGVGGGGASGNAGFGGGGNGVAGAAGFGGGGGGGGTAAGGGGGLGAGGDIFVESGASLNVEGGSLGAGTVAGGGGGAGGGGVGGGGKGVGAAGASGKAYGSGIFLQGNETITLGAGQAAGQTTTIDGAIADVFGSGGTNGLGAADPFGGEGALVVGGRDANGNVGLGTVKLAPQDTGGNALANTFTGGVTIESGVLELGDAQAAGTGAIIFASGADATLEIDGNTLPTNAIDGFAETDFIDLAGIKYTNGAPTLNGDTLSLVEGGATYSLTVNEADAGETIHAQADSSGNGTLLSVACYCRGTLIETANGPVAVEALAIGDRVKTLGGEARPIKWIGLRSYNGGFVAKNREVLPICVRAGALEENVPSRDLWLSPHHALFLEGVLIEAKDLVNGVSIVQAEKIERVDYFHIELFRHDVIFAEGAQAETFIDNDSRGMFQNAADYFALYPKAAGRRCTHAFAPRREEGFEIEAARKSISMRAGIATVSTPGELRGWVEGVASESLWGWAQDSGDPENPVCLHVYADGCVIGRVLANRYRADLKEAGLGSGRCAFRFETPKGVDLSKTRIQLRRASDAALLGGQCVVPAA